MDWLRRETLRSSLGRIPLEFYSTWLEYFRTIWPGRVALALYEGRITLELVDADYSIFDDPRDPPRKTLRATARGSLLMDVDFEQFEKLYLVPVGPTPDPASLDALPIDAFISWRDRALDIPCGLTETQRHALAYLEPTVPYALHMSLYEDFYSSIGWPDCSVPWEWPASWGMTVDVITSPFHRQAGDSRYCSIVQPLEAERWGSLGSPLNVRLRDGDRALLFYPLADPVFLSILYRHITFQLEQTVGAMVVWVVPTKWAITKAVSDMAYVAGPVWSPQSQRYMIPDVRLSLFILSSTPPPPTLSAARLVGLWDWRVRAHRATLATPVRHPPPPANPRPPHTTPRHVEPSLLQLMFQHKKK